MTRRARRDPVRAGIHNEIPLIGLEVEKVGVLNSLGTLCGRLNFKQSGTSKAEFGMNTKAG